MSKAIILLNGPEINSKNAAYGGGKAAGLRNMSLYLQGFRSESFELRPCFHSVRQRGRFFVLAFVKRLFMDTLQVFRQGRAASGMHVLGGYRTAIYREFCIVLACRLLRLPVLYHIKAGALINWLGSCRFWERKMAARILRSSKIILCEGEIYVAFLRDWLGVESHFFPNFVLSDEIPPSVSEKLPLEEIRVLFVGFCYEGKGVYELVDGCRLAAEKGLPVKLSLVGQEHEDFSRYLDSLDSLESPCPIERMGSMDHEQVLSQYEQHDVFCMPSRHKGEGHTNSINEAMSMGMVIVSTRHGFLESVLEGKCSYFLEELTPDEIARVLGTIHENRDEARRRARNARQRLMEHFISDTAFAKLASYYDKLTGETFAHADASQ